MDKKTEKIIQELLDHLPDSNHYEDCWLWCWNKLDDKCQESVKEIRKKASLSIGITKEFL